MLVTELQVDYSPRLIAVRKGSDFFLSVKYSYLIYLSTVHCICMVSSEKIT